LFGDNGVEGAHVVFRQGLADEKKYDIAIDGFFLAIGHKPQTELFKDYINLDEQGFIKLEDKNQMTNKEGVFAAGDVCDPHYQQAIIAAGTGASAALDAQEYLNEIGK
jgi:thioredoxin reductase (NADPH)